jgi:hypothetical protein
MKLKSLLILLVITSVLAGLSTLMLRPKKTAQTKIGALLFPDLPVNQVARMTLTNTESSVTLVKGSAVWQVENRYGYPADFDQIIDFVRKFSKLKVGRSFEGNAETLARLHLIDPTSSQTVSEESVSQESVSEESVSQESASEESATQESATQESATQESGAQKSGTRVQLADAEGKAIATYILGSTRSADSGSGGQYLRQADSTTVYLVDESFRFLKKKPAEWIQQNLLDIEEAEVRQVACYPAGADKPRFTVSRPEKGKPAALMEVPKDRKADPVKIEQLFGALAPLKIKDIAAERQVPAPAMEDALHLTYTLYNGQQIHIFPHKVGDGDNAHYELKAFVTYQAPPEDAAAGAAAKPAANAAEEAAADTAQKASSDTDQNTATPEEEKAPTAEEVQALTDDLGAKLGGWTFLIEEWQYKSFITEVGGLLEEVKKEESDT